jgi:hypothetical protein
MYAKKFVLHEHPRYIYVDAITRFDCRDSPRKCGMLDEDSGLGDFMVAGKSEALL